jgi:hypothetical protein
MAEEIRNMPDNKITQAQTVPSSESDLDLSKSIPVRQVDDQWSVVSRTPAQPAQQDPWAVVSTAPTQDSDLDMSKSIPVKQAQTWQEAAGSATSISARPKGTRSAIDQKLGLWGPTEVGNWIKDVEADYRQGTSATWVGSLLKKLGAKGVEYGVAPGIATPLGGVIKLAHGGTQVGEHPIRAANEMVSGVGEMLGPAAVTQPEALPFIATAEIGSKLGYHTAKYFGADDDIAEFVGNISGLTAGSHVAVKLLPTSRKSRLRMLWRRIVGLLN